MQAKLPSDPNELAKYKGIPAYHMIERNFLATIADSRWARRLQPF
jgi:hypothetical protein